MAWYLKDISRFPMMTFIHGFHVFFVLCSGWYYFITLYMLCPGLIIYIHSTDTMHLLHPGFLWLVRVTTPPWMISPSIWASRADVFAEHWSSFCLVNIERGQLPVDLDLPRSSYKLCVLLLWTIAFRTPDESFWTFINYAVTSSYIDIF